MTQEEKDLLIKDLCGRLPYGVMCKRGARARKVVYVKPYQLYAIGLDNGEYISQEYTVEDVKPFLRPMDSMTDEEKEELRKEHIKDEQLFADCVKNHPEMRGKVIPHFAADWCNKHHFNYRLPSHLFIEVTSENNPYTTENKDCSNADKDKVDDNELWWEID